MSSLWSGKNKMKLSTKKRKPSPTHHKYFPESAQSPEASRDVCTGRLSVIRRFIERTSLFASLSRGVKAGMTVEASVALPLFLFFFFHLGCAIEMIRLQGNLQLALWQVGSKMAVYGYVMDSGEAPESSEGWWKDLAGAVISATYVKGQIVDAAGADYLNASPLTDGTGSLQLWESDIFGPDDEMDIIVTYSVSPWARLVGFSAFRMANRYYGHIWNGYGLSDSGDTEENVQTVYVTETGTVYHISTECTHLNLSVRSVLAFDIDNWRNQGGGRYYPCGKCAGGALVPNVFYITEEGDRYHYSADCSGLKRTTSSMTLEQALDAGSRPCSRCGR